MKKKLLSLVFLILLGCNSNTSEIPKAVHDAFASKFPNATEVEWEKESTTEWEAEFEIEGKEYTATFNNQGNWLETEWEIPKNELPEDVLNSLATHFSSYSIEESEISETEKGQLYELEIKVGDKDQELSINQEGIIVSQQGKEEHDEVDETDDGE